MPPEKSRPNILLILTDQQRTDTLGCYGSVIAGTPHLDALARRGVVCERAYCTNPVCTPSRASIFSGLYVSRHGAWNVGTQVPQDVPFISHRLTAAGYRSHYVGKTHFQNYDPPPDQSRESISAPVDKAPEFNGPYYGFQTVELTSGHALWGMHGHYGHWVRSQVSAEQFEHYRHGIPLRSGDGYFGEAFDWDVPLRLHNSVWTADRTIAFLEGHRDESPFLLVASFQDPHHPHAVPLEYSNRVNPEDEPAPDFVPGELDDKPPHFLEARHGRLEQSTIRGQFPVAGQSHGADYTRVDEFDARRGRAYYQTLVRLIDDNVGRILETLRQRGLDENTIVIFTSDHGELLGDHGLWMKGPFHYEQLIRVPLIASWPGVWKENQRLGGLVSLADLAPTVLAAAGVAHEPLDGVDAGPALRGEAQTVRDEALVECVDDPKGLRLKTLVTADRKLTWYCDKPYGELYDLTLDPHERVNRWDDPAYARDKARMLGALLNSTEKLERRAQRDAYV